MKKIIILVIALVSGLSIQAQRQVEKKVAVTNNQEIQINFKFADDINVEQWNKNEVLVKAEVTIDDGAGDEFYSIKADSSSDFVKLYSDFGDYFKQKQKNRYNCSYTTVINYTVYLPKGAKLKVKSISGDVLIDTFNGKLITDLVSGDVTIKDYKGKLDLSSVSGELDVTINKAKVNVSSVTGTIYTNLDIEQENENRNRSGNKVIGTINNGTEELRLKTVSGNIYLRKS